MVAGISPALDPVNHFFKPSGPDFEKCQNHVDDCSNLMLISRQWHFH